MQTNFIFNMKRLRFKLEDYARGLAWYFDYGLFRLKNPILKPLPRIVNKILIIDMKFIGDLIIDTPTIRALKQHYPNSEISFLLPESMKDVLKNNPNLKNIYTSPSQINEKYDLGILLYPGDKSMGKFLKKVASFRIGIRRSGLTEPKGYHLHRKTIPTFKIKHKVEDNLDIIKTLRITPTNKHLELYNDLKSKHPNQIIMTVVSKTHPTWDSKKFAHLADNLIEKYKKKIVFTGYNTDRPKVDEIISHIKNKKSTINLAGKISIDEYISLIKNSFLVTCIDTSAQHVAAAFNVPVVSIFSAGDKKIWRPYSNNSIAIQNEKVCTSCMKDQCSLKGPRYLECANSISANHVLEQVKKLV